MINKVGGALIHTWAERVPDTQPIIFRSDTDRCLIQTENTD